MIRKFASVLACSLALSHISLAGETSPLLSSKSIMPELDQIVEDDWSFDAWLDAWIVQLSVRVQEESLGIDQHIFLGFDDIISNLDWNVPLGLDVRYKRFGFAPEFTGLKLSGSNQTPGKLFDDLSVGLKLWIINLAGYYRVIDEPDLSLDLIGGARYLYVNTDLAFTGGRVGNNVGNLRVNSTSKVWDGIVGARVQQDLTDRVFYSVYGDVGAGDSELTWQALGSLGYRVSDSFTASLGYRYLYYEDEASSSAVQVTGSGPQVRLQWEF